MGGVGSWEGGWKFWCPKLYFFDDCIFHPWFPQGPTKTWPQTRPLPNVMLRMSVAICEGSCKYRNMMVCPRKSTLVVCKPCILGCRFTSTVHTHDAHHVFAPKVRRSPPTLTRKLGRENARCVCYPSEVGFCHIHMTDKKRWVEEIEPVFRGICNRCDENHHHPALQQDAGEIGGKRHSKRRAKFSKTRGS